MNFSALLFLAAVIVFAIAAFIAGLSSAVGLIAVGLALAAAAFLLERVPVVPR
jgi:hypothetical protein